MSAMKPAPRMATVVGGMAGNIAREAGAGETTRVTRFLLGWRDWERIMTSGYVVLLCLITAAVGTGATLSADTPIRPLAPGDTMPRLEGEFLTGREAVLPDAARGKVALLGRGFSYDSRFPFEAWMT